MPSTLDYWVTQSQSTALLELPPTVHHLGPDAACLIKLSVVPTNLGFSVVLAESRFDYFSVTGSGQHAVQGRFIVSVAVLVQLWRLMVSVAVLVAPRPAWHWHQEAAARTYSCHHHCFPYYT